MPTQRDDAQTKSSENIQPLLTKGRNCCLQASPPGCETFCFTLAGRRFRSCRLFVNGTPAVTCTDGFGYFNYYGQHGMKTGLCEVSLSLIGWLCGRKLYLCGLEPTRTLLISSRLWIFNIERVIKGKSKGYLHKLTVRLLKINTHRLSLKCYVFIKQEY